MYVDQRALEAYLQLRNRLNVTFGLLERSFRALQDNRDRKTVILVSEGFVNDPSNRRLRTVTEEARRANAALYFVDTRGLETLSTQYSAEFGPPVRTRTGWAPSRTSGGKGTAPKSWPRTRAASPSATRTTSPPASCASAASPRATTCSATCPPRAPRKASSTRSRCGCAAGASSCARARAITTRAARRGARGRRGERWRAARAVRSRRCSGRSTLRGSSTAFRCA